jgi:hypothetical protein
VKQLEGLHLLISAPAFDGSGVVSAVTCLGAAQRGMHLKAMHAFHVQHMQAHLVSCNVTTRVPRHRSQVQSATGQYFRAAGLMRHPSCIGLLFSLHWLLLMLLGQGTAGSNDQHHVPHYNVRSLL